MQFIVSPDRRSKALTASILALAGSVVMLAFLAVAPGFMRLDVAAVDSGKNTSGLLANDLALIRNVDPAELGVGDIVAYRSGSETTTRRIVGVEETNVGRLFLVRGYGDKAQHTETVFDFHVTSEVVYRIPQLGFAAIFIDSVAGKVTMVMGALGVLALLWVPRQNEAFVRSRRGMPTAATAFATKSWLRLLQVPGRASHTNGG